MDGIKPTNPAPRSKKLPRDERRKKILKTAQEIFQEKGYQDTSLDAILERAGGSKRTFYTEFDGKEGLFKALMSEMVEAQIKEQEMENERSKDLRTLLLQVAKRATRYIMDCENLTLYRLMIQEGMRFPRILTLFYEGFYMKSEKYITELLEDASERGDAVLTSPSAAATAAGHFMSLLHGQLFFEQLFYIRDRITDDEIDAHVVSVVDFFIGGIRAENNGQAS